MRFKAIILDFDGTIVESVGIKDQAFKELFKNHSQHLDEIMSYHLSHNATIRYDKFEYIIKNILGLKFSADINERLSAKFSQYVLQRIIKCPLVSGATYFLDSFYNKMPIFLASVSPQQELDEILKVKGLDKYFKKIYAYPWIKKESIKEVIRSENVSAKEVLFIGDAFEDYIAAKETGIFFIGRDSKKSFNGAKILLFSDFGQIRQFVG